eukprot:RCo019838
MSACFACQSREGPTQGNTPLPNLFSTGTALSIMAARCAESLVALVPSAGGASQGRVEVLTAGMQQRAQAIASATACHFPRRLRRVRFGGVSVKEFEPEAARKQVMGPLRSLLLHLRKELM